MLIDEAGDPLLTETGAEVVSTATDFTSLLRVRGRTFSFTHLEDTPGGVMFSELAQDPTTGELSMTSTAPVDLSSTGGIWIPCAGSVTPWQSHLGSEEYPPDARSYASLTTMAGFRAATSGGAAIFASEYFGVDTSDSGSLSAALNAFRPYRYGFAVELSVSIDGAGVAGDVRAGRLRSGVLASSQVAGFSGGKWKDGTVVDSDDALHHQNEWRSALVAAADAATRTARSFQREQNDASAKYYKTLAGTLRNQLD